MSRKYIAREVLKRLQLGEPLGEELIRKFIRFLPELYENSNGYDDFAKLRHDVFSAFRHDNADRLIGFDLGVCFGAISEEESVSLDYAQEITSLRVDNSKLRELCEKLYGYYVSGTLAPCDFCDRYDCEGTVPTTCKTDEYDPDGMVVEEIERRMRELGLEAGE